MNIKVGSYEAKTKLPELLRGVQEGNQYTITLRGEAVAELVSAGSGTSPDKGAAVDDMLAFMNQRKSSAPINLKALIDEARMTFVLDASVALLWFVPQTNPQGVSYAQASLMALREGQAVAPALCALEISNVIAKLEAKGIVKEVESQRFVALYANLDIAVDQTSGTQAFGDVLQLARRFKLSAYDATYLELSMRKGLPLATLDTDLTKAAITAGVAIFGKP